MACGVALLVGFPGQLSAQEEVFAPALGIDLSAMQRSGQIYWRDLKEGEGPTARDGSLLTIHYVGWLTDGMEFDSSREAKEPVWLMYCLREKTETLPMTLLVFCLIRGPKMLAKLT